MAEEERGEYYVPPTLGELSRSLGVERGELEAYDLEGKEAPPGGVPGGAAQVSDLARGTGLIETLETQRISPRPPALLYQVVSTFDSRPIQAYDFQDSECQFINWGGAPPTFSPVSLNYTVPDNTVAVLRSFRYQVIDAPVNAVVEGDCWLQSDLFVNDLPVREYDQMLHPVFMQLFFPTFVIIDERKRLRLTLSTFDPANTEFSQALDGIGSPVIFELYGNLLLKTGVPIEFEISNPIGGGQL